MSRRTIRVTLIASAFCTASGTLIFFALLFAYQDGLPGLIPSGMVLLLLLIAFAVTRGVHESG